MSKHKDVIIELIELLKNGKCPLPSRIQKKVNVICDNIENNKAVYTVIVTLGVHKMVDPTQDIRYHQSHLKNGFSGRRIDSKYITPTLKSLELPAMAESGWLTRSLEQSQPYTKSYNGNIKNVKEEFLYIVNVIEKEPQYVKPILMNILSAAIKIRESAKIEQIKINKNKIGSIEKIVELLSTLLEEKYEKPGQSKIPVIIIYSMYQLLVNEVSRYRNKILRPLESHTSADDKTGRSGDIEIISKEGVFESIEVKYKVEITEHIINNVVDKIKKHNVERYLILSTAGVRGSDRKIIESRIIEVQKLIGVTIIVNGVINTVKYYLRLLDEPVEFINCLSDNIYNDSELNVEHKKKWSELIKLL